MLTYFDTRYMSATCMYLTHTQSLRLSPGQKSVMDPLELELQTIVSHHVGAGNTVQVVCKSSQSF